MKRYLAFLLIMTSAAVAQSTTVAVKPTAKPSAATAKAAPQAVQPTPVKVSAAPAPKSAAVSVQAAPAKAAVAVPAKGGTPTAKPASANGKANTPIVAVKPAPVPAKVALDAKAAAPAKKAPEAKVPVKAMPKPATAVKVPVKEAPKPAAEAKKPTQAQTTVAVQDSKTIGTDKKSAPKAISAVGRRDPFVSPVVKLGTGGSGCSSGKRCLAIDQIALKGVVKADVGMIAVVVNATNKAYFLRENDPVFNGYVIKITGDSIVFKETFHDRLGKSLTRDVTKTITRPAV